MRKILILGSLGYLGRALQDHLEKNGYTVKGVDNGLRGRAVQEVGGESLTPLSGRSAEDVDVCNYPALERVFSDFQPDSIIHLAELPSAPYSMIDAEHAALTQHNNIIGSLNVLWAMKKACPAAHLLKLGTAGEYPDWLYNHMTIPEGSRITVTYQGREWTIPTPRYAGSWYHFSKLHDSYNIDYACKIWGLRATDINQGPVYGHMEGTRLDYDEHFGTVVNRFTVQAVSGMPLTVYGKGEQTRGYLSIRNSLHAIELLLQNPPDNGEFRVIHQITKEYTVKQLAEAVQAETGCEIEHIENPRAEMGENTFQFERKTLSSLGLKTIPLEEELPRLINTVRKYRDRIRTDVIKPTTTWH